METDNRGTYVYLRFPLPEEHKEAMLALNARRLHNALWEMDQWLRNRCKHGGTEKTGADEAVKCREALSGFLLDEGIDLFEAL